MSDQIIDAVMAQSIHTDAVRVHPLAVVFAVAGGSYIAGIPGALFAVPTIAVLNVMVTFVARGSWRREPTGEAAEEAAGTVVPDTGHEPQ